MDPRTKIGADATARRTELIWRAIWGVLGVALFLLFLHRAWFIPETDFVAYYRAGERAWAGANLYEFDATPFKYLPATAYFFIPFTLLPFHAAKIVFYLLSFALGVVVYVKIHRRLGHLPTLLVLAVMLRFHNYDFLNSQVNHVLLYLLVEYLDRRESQPSRAGLAMAALASFKVLPFLLAGPLFLLKRYRELGWWLGWSVLMSLLPVLTFHDGVGIYSHWYRLLRDTTEFPAPNGAILQSVQGALWFWLGPVLTSPPIAAAPGDARYFSALSYLVQLALLAGCVYRAFRLRAVRPNPPNPPVSVHPRSEDERRVILATIAVTIVISPLAWKHNYLLLAPALVALIEARQFRALFASAFLLSGWAALAPIVTQHWVDRSYATLLGALGLYLALLGPRRLTRNRAR